MTEWISVKDRLPEFPQKCIILLDNGVIEFGSFTPGSYTTRGDIFCTSQPRWDLPPQWRKVTHWMPLPELPKLDN